MKNWKSTLVKTGASILDVMKVIDSSSVQVAVVVDEDRRLLGVVTDGDIRRGILKGIDLKDPVEKVMNTSPIFATVDDKRSKLFDIMREKEIYQIPVLDSKKRVIRIEFLTDILQEDQNDNWVVLMAGGLGKRLRPLTDNCPKPLLKVGNKPILETIIRNFKDYGFSKIFITVNYMAEMVEQHFGNGNLFGVDIHYLIEDQPLGTAGSLSLLPKCPLKPVIVMNADLLTNVNFRQLLTFHKEHAAAATMCVREYSFQVPYGVVCLEENRVVAIDEKPTNSFFVNAGIYVVNPELIGLIEKKPLDMTEFLMQQNAKNNTVAAFPIREYWLDIGQAEDFRQANGDYPRVFELNKKRKHGGKT